MCPKSTRLPNLISLANGGFYFAADDAFYLIPTNFGGARYGLGFAMWKEVTSMLLETRPNLAMLGVRADIC